MKISLFLSLIKILPLNHIDKKNYLREKIRSFEIDESKRVDEHGNPYYFIKNWVAGIKPENVPISVCKECFCRCYDIGRTYLTVIMKSIKVIFFTISLSGISNNSNRIMQLRRLH